MREVPHVIGIDFGKTVFQVHAVEPAGSSACTPGPMIYL
jgi:hypothetical protein